MTEKEIKRLIKNAYRITPSEKEKAFVRRYEQRRLNLFEALRLELSHMGVQSIVAVLFLSLLLVLLLRSGDTQIMWYVSGALPVTALILISSFGRSQRYGMQELEAASRFSLRFIRSGQMLLLGGVSLVLIGAFSLILSSKTEISLALIFGYVGVPYLLNVWGNLLITRKWHAKESLLGCLGVTCVSCIMPPVLEKMWSSNINNPTYILFVLLLACGLTVKECVLYIRKSEELSWNLC